MLCACIVVGWTPAAGHDAIMLDYSICEPRGVHVDPEDDASTVLATTFEAFLRSLEDCRPYDEESARAREEHRCRSHPE